MGFTVAGKAVIVLTGAITYWLCAVCLLFRLPTAVALQSSGSSTSGSKTNVFAGDDPGGLKPLEQPITATTATTTANTNRNNIWKSRQQELQYTIPKKLQSRIVGGTEAKEGRFPYIVSLLTQGSSQTMPPICGGTLIAPDIVLTSAHCSKSRLRKAQIGGKDRYEIEKQIKHPKYSDDTLDYDIMLLKLSTDNNSNNNNHHRPPPPVVTLNRDPSFPSSDDSHDQDEEGVRKQQQLLLVMGFGVTQVGGDLSTSASDTLQVGAVQYIPNHICESAKSPGVEETYEGRIQEDMLCAWGEGVDACQGDSGSGLIAKGETVGDDIQVGITSWGYRCAHPDFPGVYSRVSFFWNWIAKHVCQISNSPPPAFKCAGSSGLSTSSSSSSSTTATTTTTNSYQSTTGITGHDFGGLPQLTLLSGPDASDLVPVTLKILFDSYASETAWALQDDKNNLLESVPFGAYVDGRLQAILTFFLEKGKQYSFLIEDSYRDGLCCSSPGNYVISASLGKGSTAVKRLLVFGKGDFGAEARHDFVVPTSVDGSGGDDADAGWDNEVADSFLQRQEGTVPLRLVMELDDKPFEMEWMLERIGFHSEVVARMPAGAYRKPHEKIDLFIDLEEDELYRFTILDTGENGIHESRVRLVLGDEENGSALLDQDGPFTSSFDLSFLASLANVPLAAQTPSESNNFLTLEITFDVYPEELSWQLRADTFVGAVAIQRRASNVISFRRPRFYNMNYTNKVVQERIALPDGDPGSVQHFTLIMIDSFGDGLCCKWQGKLRSTGYKLYRGDPHKGDVLVSSSFTMTAREEHSFSITLKQNGYESAVAVDAVPASVTPMGEISVRVVFNLDDHPHETGYTISDSDGRTIVDSPPGTLREKNATLKDDIVLPGAGVYTFRVVDSHGNGIKRQMAYQMLHMGDFEGPPIISGDGNFETRREHAFVVEGDHASVPLTIHIDNSHKAFGVGCQLERLDLMEEDAIVATIPPQHVTTVTGRLVLEDGGLYRLTLLGGEEAMSTFTGVTRIAIDSEEDFREVNISLRPKFLVARNKTEWIPQMAPDSRFLSLSIPSRLNPREIDWVLMSATLEGWGSGGKAYTKRQVIAFGPDNTRSHESFRNEVTTIPLPPFEGKQTFVLIVTHSSAKCCLGAASTGLIQLFQGLPEDNAVLIGTSFDGESRLVEVFHLMGSEPQSEEIEESSSLTSFVGTAVISGGLMFVFGYVLFRSFVCKR